MIGQWEEENAFETQEYHTDKHEKEQQEAVPYHETFRRHADSIENEASQNECKGRNNYAAGEREEQESCNSNNYSLTVKKPEEKSKEESSYSVSTYFSFEEKLNHRNFNSQNEYMDYIGEYFLNCQKPVGIWNSGAECFAISVIEVLKYLYSRDKNIESLFEKNQNSLIKSLEQMIEFLQKSDLECRRNNEDLEKYHEFKNNLFSKCENFSVQLKKKEIGVAIDFFNSIVTQLMEGSKDTIKSKSFWERSDDYDKKWKEFTEENYNSELVNILGGKFLEQAQCSECEQIILENEECCFVYTTAVSPNGTLSEELKQWAINTDCEYGCNGSKGKNEIKFTQFSKEPVWLVINMSNTLWEAMSSYRLDKDYENTCENVISNDIEIITDERKIVKYALRAAILYLNDEPGGHYCTAIRAEDNSWTIYDDLYFTKEDKIDKSKFKILFYENICK